MFANQTFGAPTLTMEIVKGWASDICSKHLTDGEDPTQLLTKIAEANALTPHQIEVVAGEANKTIHTVKYASAEDKYHAADFPLANAKAVIEGLQVSNGSEKTASSNAAFGSDMFLDPVVDSNVDYHKAFGVEPETMDKTAELKQDSKAAFHKLAALSRQANDAALMVEQEKTSAELNFIKTARQYVLEGLNTKDRLVKLCEVEHAVKCANMREPASKPLSKLAYALGCEGMIQPHIVEPMIDRFMSKEADEKAPEDLISPYLRARVVDGNHPLIITLKTYADACERAKEENGRRNIVDDKLNILEQKIRAL